MSQEYEKYRTVQHKKRKAKLPNIAYAAMMDICEAECSYDTSPVEMKEDVSDRKDEKIKKNDEGKEA